MTVSELGSIGEFLGGLAVLVSLIYLALQIRQNTTSVRAAASASVAESLSRVTEIISVEPELGRIWSQGLDDYDSLDSDARTRFNTIFLTYIRRLENAFYQQSRGFLDPDSLADDGTHVRPCHEQAWGGALVERVQIGLQ